MHHLRDMKGPVHVGTNGGSLTVSFDSDGTVRLEGPAVTVFSGEISYWLPLFFYGEQFLLRMKGAF